MKTCVNIEIIYFIIFISNIIRTCGKVSVLFLPTYDISVSHASISPEEPPVRVYLNIFPITVVEIIPDRMEIELELYVNVNWTDKRLNVEVDDKLASQKIFVLPKSDAVRMWKPPLYFINCRRCQKRENLNAPTRKNYELSVNADTKQFLMFYRDSLKFRCMFDFQDYPMDEHYCKINVALRINDNRDFGKIKVFHRIMLRDKVIDQLKTKIPPEYEFLYFYATSDCLYPEWHKKDECVEYTLQFGRHLEHYLMTFYFPSYMIIILSWLTLWIDVEEASTKIIINVMCLLILSSEYSTSIKLLPTVAYVKAMDVWMMFCLISVFAILVEFFIASYIKLRTAVSRKSTKLSGIVQFKETKRDVSYQRLYFFHDYPAVNRLDKIFRLAYPLVFGLFNVVYWIYYAVSSGVRE